jgi:type I restriction enzyme, S subunit
MIDWQTVKLGDVAYEVSERVDNPSKSGYDRFVGLEHFVSGNFRIANWGTTENLISAMKLFKAGDTLFARRNAYLKRASMADFDGICSGDAIVLRNNEKMIDGFLPLILNTDHFWDYAIANAAGSMSKRVRVQDLMKYELSLPPVDEQRRIADLLWAADDALTEYMDTAEAAKNLLVRSCIDWTNNRTWKNYSLQDCSDNLDNLRVPLNKETRAKKQGDIPYYGATGIIDYLCDFIFDEEIVLLGEDGDHFYKWQDWKQSQLVRGKSWVNNHAHVFKAKTDICTNQWLYRHFQHRNLLGYIQDSASMTRRKLTKAVLLGIQVPIPSIQEQEVITDKLDEIEKTYELILAHIGVCKDLKKHLLASQIG